MEKSGTGSRYREIVVLAHLGVLASGAAALGHELIWTRRLLDLLGGTALASSRVLGAFFLGLSIGAVWAGRLIGGPWRPLRLLAAAELVVTVLSVPILTLPTWTGWLWPTVGVEGLLSPWAPLLKLLLSLVVVTPPAVAMGLALPLLLAGVGRVTGSLEVNVRLYAINTLGGALGLGLVTLWALPNLGARGSMLVAMGLNVAAAACAMRLDALVDGITSSHATRASGPSASMGRPEARLLWLAFASGALVLAIEVVGLHSMMLVATMSFYAPAALLGTVVVLLAASPWLALYIRERAPGWTPEMLALGAGALALCASPLVYWQLVQSGDWLSGGVTLGGALARMASLTAAFVGPPVLLVGLLFPLLLTRVRRHQPAGVAWLLACNGAGGLLGAEIAHHWLVPGLGPHASMGALAAVCPLVALSLAGCRKPVHGVLVVATLAGAGTLTIAVLDDLPTLNTHLGFRVLAEAHGAQGTLAVVEHPKLGRSMIANNQYVLGSTAARFDQERQAHLPVLLHPAPHRVGFLGLATGSTASAALLHPDVRHVEVVELSSNVVDAARKHFGHVNRNLSTDPRATIVQEDARTYVAAAHGRFDVLVGDLFLPWASGAGRLFSVEHFRSARRALAPGGLFCQWLPMHQLTEEQLDTVLGTLLQVFPEIHLFRSNVRLENPSLGLVALADGPLGWQGLSRRMAVVRRQNLVRDPSMRHPGALALLYIGQLSADQRPARVTNSLDNLTLELEAGRTRLNRDGPRSYLAGQRWNNYLREVLRRNRASSAIPQSVRDASRLGFLLTNWDVARRIGDPRRAAIAREVRAALAPMLQADPTADLHQWPGPRGWLTGRVD